MTRVLITSASNRLANGIIRGLRAGKKPVHVIGVDSSRYHVHQSIADERYLVPRGNHDGYLEAIERIVEKTEAEIVWPTHDAEIFRLAQVAEFFPVPVMAPPADVVATCRDKFATYKVLEQKGVPAPLTIRIHNEGEMRNVFDSMNGEIWLRPLSGAGAAGAYRPPSLKKACMWLDVYDGWGKFTASEVLPSTGDHGWESFWKNGELIAAQDMTRLVRGNTGMSIKGVKSRGVILRRAPESVTTVAQMAVRAVMPQPNGIFRVDLLMDHDGKPRVTEIEAGKFGADGVCYWHEHGYNFAYSAMKSALGELSPTSTPALNPLPRDMVSISGLNQEITFRTEAEIAAMHVEEADAGLLMAGGG